MSAAKQRAILLVEDDEHINRMIADMLQRENFACTPAFSGTEALLLAARYPYELIILDLMLPGLSGESFMHALREELKSEVPVIVLSARGELDDKLTLFKLGAVDYVTKPFEVKELLARIHVHIGRAAHAEHRRILRHKQLVLDHDTRTVEAGGAELQLTRREYRIVELLLQHPTRVFSKRDLYELAWEEPYVGDDKTITVHMSNIRSKIKRHDDQAYIDTVWGIGFRLSP